MNSKREETVNELFLREGDAINKIQIHFSRMERENERLRADVRSLFKALESGDITKESMDARKRLWAFAEGK